MSNWEIETRIRYMRYWAYMKVMKNSNKYLKEIYLTPAYSPFELMDVEHWYYVNLSKTNSEHVSEVNNKSYCVRGNRQNKSYKIKKAQKTHDVVRKKIRLKLKWASHVIRQDDK